MDGDFDSPELMGRLPFDPVLNQKSRGELADFSKWQLENVELVESVFYVLNGFHREVNDRGEEVWNRTKGEPCTLSEAGARMVQSVLYALTQKNILLASIDEKYIKKFTKETTGNIIIDLGSEPELYGLNDKNGEPDCSKLWKVKDIVEKTIYAALTRSNDYMTLKELNRGHQVHELIKQREKGRGFSLFPQKQVMNEGYA